MNFFKRLEILEDAMLRQGRDAGYQVIVTNDGETPQEAIARAGLMKYLPDRIIFITFIKADS